MRKNVVKSMILFLLLVLGLTGCSSSGGGETTNASEVPNQVVSAQVSVTGESTITAPDGPIAGTKVVIPKDAAIDPINVVIGYEDNLPALLNANAVSMGAKQVSKVIIPHVTNGGPSTFNDLVEITIPYDVIIAGNIPPIVVYWDENSKIYRPVAVIKVDKVKGTVTFVTSHFSRFMAIVVEKLKSTLIDWDTGFRVGTDSILHQNFGSYEFGGHCAAFASLTPHYFSMKKTKKMYNFAQEGITGQPLDDEIVRTALTYTYAVYSRKVASVHRFTAESEIDTGMQILQQMIVTNQPVILSLRGDNNKFRHAVTVFAYDNSNARFRIYDSNYPSNEVTFDWNILTGFGSYSVDYKGVTFDNIGYYTEDTFGSPEQYDKIISDWETGKLKDYFSNLNINDDKNISQNLIFGSDIKVVVPFQKAVTLTGKFNNPAVSKTNIDYLYVYENGVLTSTTTVPASGDISFTVNGEIAKNTEITLIVSGHERDPFEGFSAFGKFSIHNIYIRTNLNSTSGKLAIGSNMPLRAAAFEVSGNKKTDASFFFNSSNPSVAFVNPTTGDIMGISEGNSKITITETNTMVSTYINIEILSLSPADAQVLSVWGRLPLDVFSNRNSYGRYNCIMDTNDLFAEAEACVDTGFHYYSATGYFRSDLGVDSSGSIPPSGSASVHSVHKNIVIVPYCTPMLLSGPLNNEPYMHCELCWVDITPFDYYYNDIDPFE